MNLHPTPQAQTSSSGDDARLLPQPARQTRGSVSRGRNVARLLAGAWRTQVHSPQSEVHSLLDRVAVTDSSRGLSGFRDTPGSDRINVPDPEGVKQTSNVERPQPETEDHLSETELTEITPSLCQSGAGALAWRRISNTPLADTAAGQELHEVYRRFRLSALVHEREIAYVFSLLRAAGIEAVLVKGWAIARRYPDRALRPYGDIDICVRPDQLADAQRALRCLESIEGHYFDLHAGFGRIGKVQRPMSNVQRGQVHSPQSTVHSPTDRVAVTDSSRPANRVAVTDSSWGLSALCDTPGSSHINCSDPEGVKEGFDPESNVQRPSALRRLWTLDIGLWTRRDDWDEVFSRTHVVECAGEPVRIPSDEDHLRILCSHMLRSGARRPTWLCDVALLVEQITSPQSRVQSPQSTVHSPADRVAVTESSRPADRVAVTDSSRGLSAFRDTPGSSHRNVSDPEGVKQITSPTSNVQGPKSGPGEQTLDIGRWTLDSPFNWDVCLGRNAIDANWIGCAIKLAHELLGANIEHTPFAGQVQSPQSTVHRPADRVAVTDSSRGLSVAGVPGGAAPLGWLRDTPGSDRIKVSDPEGVKQNLPHWLVPAVLEQWGRERVQRCGRGSSPTVREGLATVQRPTSNVQRHLGVRRLWTVDSGLWTSLYSRWNNPIRATAAVGGRFNNWPRLPYRLAESIMRLRELPGKVQRSEVRGQRSEIRGQESEIRIC